jgi:hypothetical protein
MLIADSADNLMDGGDLLNWTGPGFYIGGDNAVYHTLQFAVFKAVNAWKKGWASSLKSVEENVLPKVSAVSKAHR